MKTLFSALVCAVLLWGCTGKPAATDPGNGRRTPDSKDLASDVQPEVDALRETAKPADTSCGDGADVSDVPPERMGDQDECVPSCEGKECGEDGCGGECGECDDKMDTTVDYCVGGRCVFDVVNCDDGNDCTDDWIGECGCEHSVRPLSVCCLIAGDCGDGNPCELHACDQFHCVTAVLPLAECCAPALGDQQCETGDPCLAAECSAASNSCVWLPKSLAQQSAEGLACCAADADCSAGGIWEEDSNGDGVPGPDVLDTLDICVSGQCYHAKVPADCDCKSDAECLALQTGNCKIAECVAECRCGLEQIPGCCESDLECSDGASYTHDICVNYACAHTVILNECASEIESQMLCEDMNKCTNESCLYNICYHSANLKESGCCAVDSDCYNCKSGSSGHCIGAQCVPYK